jgi:hypothetical protein
VSAPARVPGAAIKEALRSTGGNVTAAAARVGMAPNNLRKRLPGLGEDLGAFREARSRSLRVSAETFSRLREAKFDLQHQRRRELDEADVLALFVEDAFAGWLEAKLRC